LSGQALFIRDDLHRAVSRRQGDVHHVAAAAQGAAFAYHIDHDAAHGARGVSHERAVRRIAQAAALAKRI
jgi:hypothetical protein